jgi:hypothetical protein
MPAPHVERTMDFFSLFLGFFMTLVGILLFFAGGWVSRILALLGLSLSVPLLWMELRDRLFD